MVTVLSQNLDAGIDIIELIRSIQRADGQVDCFRSGLNACSRTACPWRSYCLETSDAALDAPGTQAEVDFMTKVRVQKIVCATDFSDLSNQGLHYAIDLARRFDAKLYVCHIIDLPPAGTGEDVHLYPLRAQNERLETAFAHLERLLASQPVDWQPLITIGDPADEICRMARGVKADLAVAASHGRSGIKRLILGSVTEQLMRLLPCPMLTVRGSSAEDDGTPRQLRRILVGCDFSYDAGLALQYGLCLSKVFEAEIHLAHVIEPPVYRNLQKIIKDPDTSSENEMRTFLETELGRLVPAGAGVPMKTILLNGQPFKELTRYAEMHGIDLIVLGVRGRGLVETFWLGSTTDRVVRQAPCAVLSVQLPNHQADFSF